MAGFILIIIYIIAFITLSFLVAYYDKVIEQKEVEIKEIKDGTLSPSPNWNITELEQQISNQTSARNFFNELLWLSMPLSILGIILITYGCLNNPNYHDVFELIKIIGIISLIVGMVLLPMGYFFSLQNTPFGYNEYVDVNERRLSNDLSITGIIFISLGLSLMIHFISTWKKMKNHNIKSSTNLKKSKKQSKTTNLSSENKDR